MSFISRLFGGGEPAKPAPTQAAPKISDAQSTSLAREEAARIRGKKGVEDTILTAGLGDVGAGTDAPLKRATLLGGSA